MPENIELRLTAHIEYEPFDEVEDRDELISSLRTAATNVIEHGMSHGFFSGEELASVVKWETQVELLSPHHHESPTPRCDAAELRPIQDRRVFMPLSVGRALEQDLYAAKELVDLLRDDFLRIKACCKSYGHNLPVEEIVGLCERNAAYVHQRVPILKQRDTLENTLAKAQAKEAVLRRGCLELGAALSRIDYLCGAPNDMEVSGYDVHQNEDAVVAAVQKLRDRVKELERQINASTDEYPLALRELAARTGTTPGIWVAWDGPASGVGEDYYYIHPDLSEIWWVCVDQGEVTQVQQWEQN